MKTKILGIIIMLAIVSFAFGQERIDVVHLKNGDIVKGVIVENIPNDCVKIELQGGSILIYKYVEIDRLTRELSSTIMYRQQQTRPEPQYNADAQKMMMYNSQKKDPATAVVLSCLLTSTGHAYAGNWGRGVKFTMGRLLCFLFAVTAGIEIEDAGDATEVSTGVNGMYTLGMFGVFVTSLWEIADARMEVIKYNQALHNRIYTGKPSFGMNIVPNRDGANLMLTYNF